MLTPRYLVTISVSAVMALAWGVSATAQTTSPPRSKFERLTQVHHQNNTISQAQEQSSPPASETIPQLEENQPSPPMTVPRNQTIIPCIRTRTPATEYLQKRTRPRKSQSECQSAPISN
ncbi:MAG: hypothetical protein HC763_02410 [Hydrococcus sp. CRU_1_1]|nr:hypothetical protein [Hydrococcus sp. CRU_1_1]